MIELSLETVELLLLFTGALLLVLIVSVISRPLIFTQYLHHMTGIRLSPRDVSRVFKTRGRAGVREMFLDLIIREDLKDTPRITPDTPPDREILTPLEEE
ncbi:MAG: hypothetical protein HXY19_00450 [Thermoanaerobaculaceae bacterium]|jgi:hypothetical protein|nr:hypothetical protein [Thermoanaerobaculaceae bacterium]